MSDEYLSELSKCRKCRFCIDQCPTFTLLDNIEVRGPYGRVQMLKFMLKGFYDVEDSIIHSIYSCLRCGQCNVVCGEVGEALEVSELIRYGRNILISRIKEHKLSTPEANLINYVLDTLSSNIIKKYDPVGIGGKYWVKWVGDLNIPRRGSTVLYTSRMYQMTPYLTTVTDLMKKHRDMLMKGKMKGLIKVGTWLGVKWAGIKADRKLEDKSSKALYGIALTLKKLGVEYSYLYDDEPYCGTLLYDLGLDECLKDYIPKVVDIFRKHNVEKLITVDPHTHHMLKDVYPEYSNGFNIEVIHYLELLNKHVDELSKLGNPSNREYVIHDPCTMARYNGIIEEPRNIAERLNIKLIEPKRSKLYTKCCGGPIEYAYPDYTDIIARDRVSELSRHSNKIITYCPICLTNFVKHSGEFNTEVYDFGEVLYEILHS